jgi:predicted exporter
MALHKIDKTIKEKLLDRTIQPSAKAWDRLDAMLAYQEVKAKKTFPWLKISAVFAGILMLGILWQVNNEQHSILIPSENDVVFENQSLLDTTNDGEVLIVNVVPGDLKEIAYPKIEGKEILVSREVSKHIVEENINDSQFTPTELQQETEEIQDYAAARALLAEINTEGKNFSRNIASNVSGSITVDVESLLNTAENEIENSFRDKVIHKINKNYNTLKSTVANRNNQ